MYKLSALEYLRYVTFRKDVTCTEKFQSEPVG